MARYKTMIEEEKKKPLSIAIHDDKVKLITARAKDEKMSRSILIEKIVFGELAPIKA